MITLQKQNLLDGKILLIKLFTELLPKMTFLLVMTFFILISCLSYVKYLSLSEVRKISKINDAIQIAVEKNVELKISFAKLKNIERLDVLSKKYLPTYFYTRPEQVISQ